MFDNIRVSHGRPNSLLSINTPVDVVTITNSHIGNNPICFSRNSALSEQSSTKINMIGCVFTHNGAMDLLRNEMDNAEILLKTSASIELHSDFSAGILAGNGNITVGSDLTGLE